MKCSTSAVKEKTLAYHPIPERLFRTEPQELLFYMMDLSVS
jgi:hypothetical protein